MSLTPCEIIIRLDEEVLAREDQWVKRVFQAPDGRVCLMAGVYHAGEFREWLIEGLAENDYSSILIVKRVLLELIEARLKRGITLTYYNDYFAKWEDIRSLITEARERICNAQ